MRVAVCYRARAFLGPEAASNLDQLRKLGWCAGLPSPEVLAFVDPLTKEGEGAVPIRFHPDVMLAAHPELWRFVDQWRCGARRRLRPGDYDTLSGFEVEAILVMQAAQSRQDERDIPRAPTS